jgi:hypothetical protein
MFKATAQSKQHNRRSVAARVLWLACGSLAWMASAQAQFTTEGTAQNNLTCAADRGAGSCTAKEFTVAVTATQGSNVTNCVYNQPVTIDIVAGITSNSPDRYNIALFVGNNGNSPMTAGGTCAVATFPTTPSPWFSGTGNNACGDYHGPNMSSQNLIHNVTVLCVPDPTTGELSIPYGLTYQQSDNACTGPTDVQPGSPSKCVSGGTPVQGVTVLYNADPACSKSVQFDPAALTVTSTITISNNGPDTAFATTFDDPVPATITVTGATCGNVQGSAVCPASLTVNGNDVSGTIPSIPVGGSVDIVINGTVPPGSHDTITNIATVAPGPLTINDNPANNSCQNNQLTLPVRLQSFDVR